MLRPYWTLVPLWLPARMRVCWLRPSVLGPSGTGVHKLLQGTSEELSSLLFSGETTVHWGNFKDYLPRVCRWQEQYSKHTFRGLSMPPPPLPILTSTDSVLNGPLHTDTLSFSLQLYPLNDMDQQLCATAAVQGSVVSSLPTPWWRQCPHVSLMLSSDHFDCSPNQRPYCCSSDHCHCSSACHCCHCVYQVVVTVTVHELVTVRCCS